MNVAMHQCHKTKQSNVYMFSSDVIIRCYHFTTSAIRWHNVRTICCVAIGVVA